MKFYYRPVLQILSCLPCIGGVLIAQTPSKPQFRTAPTHEDLVKIQREKMAEGKSTQKNVTFQKAEDFSKVEPPTSIIARSDFISANGLITMVPKRAIIFVPEAYKANITIAEGAKLVTWADFYAANRSWIEGYEVTRSLAEGDEAITEETQERFTKSKKMVVATVMGGPISVLPLKEVDTEKAATNEQTNN